MRSSVKIAAVAATAALAIAGLGACSSSSGSEAAPSGSAVGGMTTCDAATVGPEALKAAQAINANNTFEVQDVACDSGWAVATGILGGGAGEEAAESDAESSSEGDAAAPQGAPTSFIFEAEGQFWVPKTAADVCGTIDGTTYPSDAQIPEALYAAGCLAG